MNRGKSGAAQESNLPTDGLRRLTGFEDRLGTSPWHRAHEWQYPENGGDDAAAFRGLTGPQRDWFWNLDHIAP